MARWVRLLIFEFNRVWVYNSTIFRLTDLHFYTFSFQTNMPKKTYKREMAKNLRLMIGKIVTCNRKSQLAGIRAELLNQCDLPISSISSWFISRIRRDEPKRPLSPGLQIIVLACSSATPVPVSSTSLIKK